MKDIKRNTQLVIISVIVLTIATLGVSYSAFFSVQTQSTVQKIKAGVLDVVIDSSSLNVITDDLFPTANTDLPSASDSEEDQTQAHSSITLTNSGTIDADYSVTLNADTVPSGKTEIDYQYINIGIVDVTNNTWHNFGTNETPIYHTALTSLGSNGVFPILRSTLGATLSKQYRIYIWLSEDTPTTEIGNAVYLKLEVKSKTINGTIES